MKKTDEQLREIGKRDVFYSELVRICGKQEAENALGFWERGYRYKENEKPELKPLSDLTEEHAVEICRIASVFDRNWKVTKYRAGGFKCKSGSAQIVINTNGDVDIEQGGELMYTLNQAQIIKFYLDNGYDIFNQNGR